MPVKTVAVRQNITSEVKGYDEESLGNLALSIKNVVASNAKSD